MKFLCVKCDHAMAIKEVSGPDDQGSLAVIFKCDNCSHAIALLTNAHETQLVASLGVSIGGSAPKCPFTATVRGALDKSAQAAPDSSVSKGEFEWTAEARARLDRIPEFVRPMAVSGIENFARTRGYTIVDERVLDEARGSFGM